MSRPAQLFVRLRRASGVDLRWVSHVCAVFHVGRVDVFKSSVLGIGSNFGPFLWQFRGEVIK